MDSTNVVASGRWAVAIVVDDAFLGQYLRLRRHHHPWACHLILRQVRRQVLGRRHRPNQRRRRLHGFCRRRNRRHHNRRRRNHRYCRGRYRNSGSAKKMLSQIFT